MAKTKVTGEYLKDSVVRFTAKAGENITKGNAVYISGISGELPVVSLADADDTAKMPAFGLAETTVSTNDEVEVTSFGTLANLDTSSYTLGDILYVGTTAGALTNDPAGLEATKLQNIGIVQRVHASNGSIKVGGAGRTNAVPNLDDGDIFIGDSNNKAVSSALSTEIESYLDGGTSTPTFSSVGIGTTTTPSDDLHVVGDIRINSNTPQLKFTSADNSSNSYSISANINDSTDGGFFIQEGLVNGTNVRLAINASGNVGIGLTNPSSLLHLDASSNAQIRFSDTQDPLNNFIGLQTLSDGLTIACDEGNASSNSRIIFKVDGSEVGRFEQGDFGIGTTSPFSPITVKTDTDHAVSIRTKSDGTGSRILGTNLSGAAYDELALDGDELLFHISGTEKMKINSSGNVGIGRTDPQAKLHLQDTNDVHIQFTDEGNVAGRVGANGNALVFGVDGSNGTTERMRIDSNGAVGINETSIGSGYKLQVKTPATYGDDDTGNISLTNTPSGTASLISPIGIDFGDVNDANSFLGRIQVHQTNATASTASVMKFYTNSGGGNTNTQERMRIESGGDVSIGSTSAGGYRLKITAANSTEGTGGKNAIFQTLGNAGNVYIFNALGTGVSTTGSAIWVQKNSSTNRSLNAAGTLNASGADYAEYMKKSSSCGTIAKGDVCGVDSLGELTDVYADAVSFVVKSTNPSYVGGDTWGADDLNLSEEELETERQKYDRIAFSGQVPVNITGSFNVGDYVYPQANGSAIECVAKSNPTFEEYQKCVGKVWAIEDDGRPRIAVKIG